MGLDLTYKTRARGGGGGCNTVDDGLIPDGRFRPPVLADEREQPMFDLVPLARARREVTDRNLQPDFVGQFLQFPLPQPHPCPVAASGIGGNLQALPLPITARAPPPPPTAHHLPRQSPPA